MDCHRADTARSRGGPTSKIHAMVDTNGVFGSRPRLPKCLKTSRSQLDRILDPANDQVSLASLVRTAHAVGKRLRLELEEAARFVGCGASMRAMA
jgi:hypothetical protein